MWEDYCTCILHTLYLFKIQNIQKNLLFQSEGQFISNSCYTWNKQHGSPRCFHPSANQVWERKTWRDKGLLCQNTSTFLMCKNWNGSASHNDWYINYASFCCAYTIPQSRHQTFYGTTKMYHFISTYNLSVNIFLMFHIVLVP